MNDFFASEYSIIEAGVEIGEGSKIWHFTHIMEGAKIGLSCVISEHVFIGRNVLIGDNVHIQNGSQIPEGVIIRNNVFIGNNVSFDNVKYPRAWRKAREYLTTIVEDNATVKHNAAIQAGVKIGKGSTVGEGAIVTHDVSPGGFVVTPHAECICEREECQECSNRKRKANEKRLRYERIK